MRSLGHSHIAELKHEAIHMFCEVAAELERPALVFSGGKDFPVMLRLAEKAFWPTRIPFPVMPFDTGHNFPEVLELRDRRAAGPYGAPPAPQLGMHTRAAAPAELVASVLALLDQVERR